MRWRAAVQSVPHLAFAAMKLTPESGANRIKTAGDAIRSLAHLRLSIKIGRQFDRQALNRAGASDASENPGLASVLGGG